MTRRRIGAVRRRRDVLAVAIAIVLAFPLGAASCGGQEAPNDLAPDGSGSDSGDGTVPHDAGGDVGIDRSDSPPDLSFDSHRREVSDDAPPAGEWVFLGPNGKPDYGPTDAGGEWRSHYLGGYDLWGDGLDDLMVVGSVDFVYHGGHVWFPVDSAGLGNLVSPYATFVFGVWGRGPKDVWAVGDWRAPFHYDGDAWSLMPAGGSSVYYGVCGDDSNVWITGDNGKVERRTATTTTSYDVFDSTVAIHRCSVGRPDRVWAVGNSGSAAVFDGVAWSRVPTGATADVLGVWALGDDAWVVSREGVLRWNGSTLVPVAGAPTGSVPRTVWGNSPGDVWVGGASGFVAHTDGKSWSSIPLPIVADVTALWGDGTVLWALVLTQGVYERRL